MQTETFNVTGMICTDCTSKIAYSLNVLTGVQDVMVSFEDERAAVRYDERLTAPNRFQLALQAAGYGVRSTDSTQNRKQKTAGEANQRHGIPESIA